PSPPVHCPRIAPRPTVCPEKTSGHGKHGATTEVAEKKINTRSAQPVLLRVFHSPSVPSVSPSLSVALLLPDPHRMHHASDMPAAERNRRPRGIPSVDLRHVVRHHHVAVPHLLIHRQRPCHVHAPLIGKHLHEIQLPPRDIAEMHIENLIP